MFWLLLMLMIMVVFIDRRMFDTLYLGLPMALRLLLVYMTCLSPTIPFISQSAALRSGVRREANIESFCGSQTAPAILLARLHSLATRALWY